MSPRHELIDGDLVAKDVESVGPRREPTEQLCKARRLQHQQEVERTILRPVIDAGSAVALKPAAPNSTDGGLYEIAEQPLHLRIEAILDPEQRLGALGADDAPLQVHVRELASLKLPGRGDEARDVVRLQSHGVGTIVPQRDLCFVLQP